MKKLKLKKLKNRELIESAIKQIEDETKFHIVDVEFGDTYFLFTSKEKNTICHFHIKEIPGFKFAFWNTCRFDKIQYQLENKGIGNTWADSLEINPKSELVFFTQYEKYLDKFKPSRSGFVTGIFRQVYEQGKDNSEETEIIEEWNMYNLVDILKYMKKNIIKAIWYSSAESKYIWEEVSYFTALKDFIGSTYHNHKYNSKKLHAYNKCKRAVLRCIKHLKYFDAYVLKELYCTPSLFVYFRHKDNYEDNSLYRKELDIIDRLHDKYFNDLSLQLVQVTPDINENLDKEERKKDNDLKKRFKSLNKRYYNANPEEYDEVPVYTNVKKL